MSLAEYIEKHVSDTTSVAEMHSMAQSYFNHIDEKIIPQMRIQLKCWKFKIKEMNGEQMDREQNNKEQMNETLNSDLTHARHQYSQIRKKIKELEQHKLEYYMTNSSILFSHFKHRRVAPTINNRNPRSGDQLTNEAEPNNGSSNESTARKDKPVENYKMRQFFAKKPNSVVATSYLSAYQDGGAGSKIGGVDKANGGADVYLSPAQIQNQYLQNVRNELTDIKPYIVPYNLCICGRGELIPYEEDGTMICNSSECGNMVPYITGSSCSDGKDQPNEISYSSYTRLVHFKEIIAQTQGRSTGHISTDIIEKVRDRVLRERITDLDKLTIDKMRNILRTLKLTDNYFDHVQYLRKLMGVPIPAIPESLQTIFGNMFLEVQRPWNIHKPEARHNFSNCGYLLFQFCVLTNQTQYLSHIHLLQRDKLEEHDDIFQKVCRDLGWKFTPIPK